MNIWIYDLSTQSDIFTFKEAKKEYSRLRSIANKRLQRLGKSEFAGSTTYKNWSAGFETLENLGKERDLRKALYDVARFLNTKTSTVTGARKAQSEFVKTMNEMGYTFINRQNAQQFGEFMREVKKHADYKGRDSEQLVDLYKTAKEKRIEPLSLAKNYEKWFDNEKLYEAQKRTNNTISFDEFLNRVERKK